MVSLASWSVGTAQQTNTVGCPDRDPGTPPLHQPLSVTVVPGWRFAVPPVTNLPVIALR